MSSLAKRLRDEGRLEGMEKGIKEGIEKGMEKGKRQTLIDNVITLLTIKFGAIPTDMEEKISKLSPNKENRQAAQKTPFLCFGHPMVSEQMRRICL
ncbi:MAG TPA: hypothetical protein VFC70_04550 [Oscillospiraceae bacterium]|nr:hypothetical protein [Oscillospiraceae bacterium]